MILLVQKSVQIRVLALSYGSCGNNVGPWSGYASSRNSQMTVLSYSGLLSYCNVGTRPRGLSFSRLSGLW